MDELNFLVIRGLQANFPGILIPPLPPNLVVPKEGEARPAAPRMALPAAAPPALFMVRTGQGPWRAVAAGHWKGLGDMQWLAGHGPRSVHQNASLP